jgi:hypothetical protein
MTLNSMPDEQGIIQPIDTRGTHDGYQRLYRFENGYGASVVRNPANYGGKDGLWELAVIRFDDDGTWSLTCDTPVTEDVLGWLDESQVQDYLHKIRALQSP